MRGVLRLSPRTVARSVARRQQSQRHASTSAVLDIASEADLKSGSTSEEGNVLLARKKVDWKPRSAASRVAVEASQVFCASNDPLQHTIDDIGRFYQLEGGTAAFELFYHTGFCGNSIEERARRLQSSAMMVRQRGLAVRDELLQWQQEGTLGEQSGLLLTGELGVGKSSTLNYLLSCCQQAGWLVVALPHAADWTLGLGAKSAQFANEAYRVSDPAFFTQVPPELEGSELYENPDASAHLLISTYLSQKPKLEQVLIKQPARIEHYASAAADQQRGPTLADMLAPYVTDEHGGFSDFPMPLRPVYDFLHELPLVTELPTVLAVDGYNAWEGMASSCHWHSQVPPPLTQRRPAFLHFHSCLRRCTADAYASPPSSPCLSAAIVCAGAASLVAAARPLPLGRHALIRRIDGQRRHDRCSRARRRTATGRAVRAAQAHPATAQLPAAALPASQRAQTPALGADVQPDRDAASARVLRAHRAHRQQRPGDAAAQR